MLSNFRFLLLRARWAACLCAALLVAPAFSAPDPLDARWTAFVLARNEGRPSEARAILDELVAKGYPRALTRLGNALRAGEAWYGMGVDLARALSLYEKAWAAGDAGAAQGIGLMYYLGEGRPKDDAQALEWFRKGAEGGTASSQTMLGLMAQNGRGGPQDCLAAENHYIKAVELGSDTAKYNLGNLYDKGCPGFAAQPARAMHWMRESAKAGDDDAKAYVARREQAASVPAPAQPRALGQMGGGGEAMDRLFRGALLAAAEMGFKAGQIDNEGRVASLYRSYQGHEVQLVLRVPPRGNTVNGQMMVRDDDVRTGFIRLYRQELAKQVGTSIELDGNISGR